jgi:hypothetical protein
MLVEHRRKDRMANSDAIHARLQALEERLAHCHFLLHERFIDNPPLANYDAAEKRALAQGVSL